MRYISHFFTVLLGLIVIGLGKFFDAFGIHFPIVASLGTAIADLWTPDVWIPGLAEQSTVRPSLINSGIAVRNAQLTEVASGGGITANVPFFKEPNFADEIQVQGTAPTKNVLTSGKQIAPILNRVSASSYEALAGGVSGTDPVAYALNVMAGIRLRQRQTALLNILRGVFGNAAAPNAGSAAFKANRSDIFLEAGASPAAGQLFSSDAFIDALSLLGEAGDEVATDGVIVCHSLIAAGMLKGDDIDYFRTSEGLPMLRRYKGMAVFVSDLLKRAGGTSGSVYDTYAFLPGAVGTGDKPQTNVIGDVASLTTKDEASTNTNEIYDRTRFVLHPQGAKWTGTPAGQSATNAELATEGNWALAYGDVKNVRMVCLRTNG